MVLPKDDITIFNEIVHDFLVITGGELYGGSPKALSDIYCAGTSNHYNRLCIALKEKYSMEIPMLEYSTVHNRSKVLLRDLVSYISSMSTQEEAEDNTDEEQREIAEEGEHDGGDVNYYVVEITDPKRFDAYMAEAEDIIEALDMSFSEGTAFKSIWRKAAMRTLGKVKLGSDALYNAQKVAYYGARMVAIEERKVDEE